MHRRLLLVAVLLAAACGESPASTPSDSGDGEQQDSAIAPGHDAASAQPPDAGASPSDASGPIEADAASTSPIDASEPHDAAATLVPDTGAVAGHDAGPVGKPDAGPVAKPDAGPVAKPDAGAPAQGDAAIVIPATSGSIDLAFQVDATGQGTDRLGSISVVKNAADLEFNSVDQLGLAYMNHPPFGGYLLYDIVSIAQDGSDLSVTYLYCTSGGKLPYAYTEGLLEPMTSESASGNCTGKTQSTHVTVDMPALQVTPQAFDTGITINGSKLTLGSAGGTVQFAGQTYTVVPFNTVDCSSCPGGSWYEIHSMLMQDEVGCFAILYLMLNDKNTVDLEYALCLPSLTMPSNASFTASWSGTLQARQGPPPPPLPAGVEPPPFFRPLPSRLLNQR